MTEDPHSAANPAVNYPDVVADAEEALTTVAEIPVHISYEIIRLFSEGLYQSPQKAVEELVSNSYDAGAGQVHVLLPDPDYGMAEAGAAADAADYAEEGVAPDEGDLPPLWVIDDGSGMDGDGFTQLWRVADSHKAGSPSAGRAPIGQFGIGKLAAYVLAWRLTHISKVDGVIRMTSMNFRRLAEVHQYNNTDPIVLDLKELSEPQAMDLMTDIKERDEDAWGLMFGDEAKPSWTAARLSDFKDLYDKLSYGRLDWVLRTGLPLHGEFQIWLNGGKLESSKESRSRILEFELGSADDDAATTLGLDLHPRGGVVIPGIDGAITGRAEVFEKRLTEGKSDQYGRSNGFFVRVRGRVVNLEDALFGLSTLNHATWSRFSMEINADGLRDHLLSSREGVRESDAVDSLKRYMLAVFNKCRKAYDDFVDLAQNGIDIKSLLTAAPSAFLTEPIIETVRIALESGEESYYTAAPALENETDPGEWFGEYAAEVESEPFTEVVVEKTGEYDRVVRYYPSSRRLVVNSEHPFIDKLLAGGKGNAPAALFGSSEFLIEAILQDYGVSRQTSINLLADRDKVLRIIAGDQPSTAIEALRLLKSALDHDKALERAVGAAFRVLGFEYERRGGNVGGTDGVLYARLGRGAGVDSDDYKIVYDAKQTNRPSVPADKIDFASLETFRKNERANYGFFVAKGFEGSGTPGGKINEKLEASRDAGQKLSLLQVDQLRRLVELHYKFGVPLTKVRSLFAEARGVDGVEEWLDQLEADLKANGRRVPLLKLLEQLESQKTDELAVPSIKVARVVDPSLKAFRPEDLSASLRAVETIIGTRWIEVNVANDEVRLHGTASQIVAEVDRNMNDMFGEGVNAADYPPIVGAID